MIVVGVIIFAAALAVVLRDRIENLFAVSIIGLTIVAYLCARIGTISLVMIAPIALCIVAAVYLGYRLCINRDNMAQYILTPGFVIFVMFCLLLALLCTGHNVAGSPDALYWVTIAKGIYFDRSYWDMFRFFSSGTLHPQFIAIWAYLSEKTWPNWSDGVIIATNDILLISYLMPLFSFVDRPKSESLSLKHTYYAKNTLLAICIFILPYISDTSEYSIYASDMVMALALGMGVVLFRNAIASDMNRYYIYSAMYFMSAVITKRVAIVVLSIFFIWMFYLLIGKKEYKAVALYTLSVILEYALLKGTDKYVLVPIAALVIAIFCYLLRKRNSVLLYAAAAIVGISSVIIVMIHGIMSFRYAEKIDQLSVMKAYFKMPVTTQSYYVGEFIHLPLAVFIVINILVYVYIKKNNIFSMDRYAGAVFAGLLLFTVTYLTLMFYLYMTDIAAANGEMSQSSLLAVSRYMKIIPAIYICYWFGILVPKANVKSMSIVLIIIMLLANLAYLSKFVIVNDYLIVFPEIEEAGLQLDKDKTIAYIDMNSVSHYNDFFFSLFYKTNVVKVDELSWTYRFADGMSYVDSYELETVLNGADYLYIYYADDKFRELYKDLFANPEDIDTDRGIYSFNPESGKYVSVYSN